jgi:hypothetical protein
LPTDEELFGIGLEDDSDKDTRPGRKKRGDHFLLPRRSPTARRPHHYCPRPRNGLYENIQTSNDHLLTYSCGKQGCRPCRSFDRDSRYDDAVYAFRAEVKSQLLRAGGKVRKDECGEPIVREDQGVFFYFETNDARKYKNFVRRQRGAVQAHRRRCLKKEGLDYRLENGKKGWTRMDTHVRRWKAFSVGPDGHLLRRVITPIPDRDTRKLGGLGEAQRTARRILDEIPSRGSRRTIGRCNGAWMQEPPEQKYRRISNAPDDLAAVLHYLSAKGIPTAMSLFLFGMLMQNVALLYTSAEQQQEFRDWLAEHTSLSRRQRPDKDAREELDRMWEEVLAAAEARRATGLRDTS